MSMSTITCPPTPTRSSVYRMFNEAWGWFCGNLSSTNMVSVHEKQIKFDPTGHNHSRLSTTSGGYPIGSAAVEKRHFDLNDCLVGWADLFGKDVGADMYGVFAGAGTCPLAVSTAWTEVMNGSAYIDYNPNAAAAPGTCTLDIRAATIGTSGSNTTAYDINAPFNTNWVLIGAWALPDKSVATGATWADHVYNYRWGSNGTGPMFNFEVGQANAATVGVLNFDYLIVCRKL